MTDCIEGKGAKNSSGYPQQKRGGKQAGMHRWTWIDHNGPIPKGLCVCHRCDNRACINIDHLFLGTSVENTADRTAKGRTSRRGAPKGAANGLSNAVLTEEQVVFAMARMLYGEKQTEVARSFGVCTQAMWRIWHRQTWKWLF